jgi:Uri superfamily endonuclease
LLSINFTSFAREKNVIVGKLGLLNFPPGTYIYTGRHQTNLAKRINRHLRKEKKIHWHIDFITADNQFIISHIAVFLNQFDECSINTDYRSIHSSQINHPGFGASDCRSKCNSHLSFHEKFLEKLYTNWLSNYPNTQLFKVG